MGNEDGAAGEPHGQTDSGADSKTSSGIDSRTESETESGIGRGAPPTRGRTRERVIEIVTVLVLSVTAVLTAWCGFQASKWGGEMSIAFSQASTARIKASAASDTALSYRQYDLAIYIEWVRAENSGDTQLASFIEQRFTPELRTAFDAWNAGGRSALGPLTMKEYVPPGTQDAKALNARADARFAAALVDNARGDRYSLLTVLFALVLFLTAMSQRGAKAWMQNALLGLGLLAGIFGVVLMLTFPIDL